MKYIITVFILAILIIITFLKSNKNHKYIKKRNKETDITEYINAYKPKWILTNNEKDAYKKIKEVTDEYGYTTFAKVRLFDLIEPKNRNPKFRYKIQAKHVDFVICDKKLVARYIIELDDSSHNEPDRINRDEFVDSVLKATGYNVIHIKSIDKEQIKSFLQKNEKHMQE